MDFVFCVLDWGDCRRDGWVTLPGTGTDNHPMTKPTDKTEAQTRQADQDLLFKGIVICLIGVAILLGPFFARSPAVQELLGGARVVGWFALVLGVAFLGQYFLRRRARR
jgi:uncharacterized membrane protein HdeD (DUF308 family)